MATRRQLAIIFTSLGLVLLLAVTPLWRLLQGTMQPLLLGPAKWLGGARGYLSAVTHLPQVLTENEALRGQLANLAATEAAITVLQQQNDELRKLGSVPNFAAYQALGAAVVGERSDATGTTYLIDRGATDGVLPGAPVVVGLAQPTANPVRAVLIGVVASTSAHVSTVAPLTSPIAQVAVEVVGVPGASAMAAGEYNLAVGLSLLPPTATVTAGASVVTSHLNELIPPGLLVGQVISVAQVPGDFFKSAVVAPVGTPKPYHFVTVLIHTP